MPQKVQTILRISPPVSIFFIIPHLPNPSKKTHVDNTAVEKSNSVYLDNRQDLIIYNVIWYIMYYVV